MRKRHFTITACFVAAVAVVSLAADSEPEAAPDDAGLRIALSSIPGELTGVFRLEVENAGDKDVMVNLGMMLGAGKVMLPEAVSLILVDAKGASKELSFFDRRYPGVGASG